MTDETELLFSLDQIEPWRREWRGMPEFSQDDLTPYKSVIVHFSGPGDMEEFSKLVGQTVGPRTQSVWFPPAEIGRYSNKRFVAKQGYVKRPRYPVYIPTKGRHEKRFTIKTFQEIGVDFRIVVEPQEVELYAPHVKSHQILTLPFSDRGLVATRNWIWDHAAKSGIPRFWTFDDNIVGLYRLYKNLKTPVGDGSTMAAIEDFADRYENLPVCGMNYFMFASRKEPSITPYTPNTRVYSNMLIETDARDPNGVPYRNEGFYNDDTDLCLRILKDGFPTVLFNAFLIGKQTTMTSGGGMTPHYLGDGRYKMAEELQKKHPDVTKITVKWGRYQHHVDYSRFKNNQLRRKPGVVNLPEVDERGIELQDLIDGKWVTREAVTP